MLGQGVEGTRQVAPGGGLDHLRLELTVELGFDRGHEPLPRLVQEVRLLGSEASGRRIE